MSNDQQVEKTAQEPDSNRLPGDKPRVVQEMVMSAFRSGPTYHPIFDKFESQHVTQFLTDASEIDAAKHQMRMGNRWFRLAYVGIAVAMFIFLTM